MNRPRLVFQGQAKVGAKNGGYILQLGVTDLNERDLFFQLRSTLDTPDINKAANYFSELAEKNGMDFERVIARVTSI